MSFYSYHHRKTYDTYNDYLLEKERRLLHRQKVERIDKLVGRFVQACLVLCLLLLIGYCLFFADTSRRIGAICGDDRLSQSTGSGTCSWHGGVDVWLTERSCMSQVSKELPNRDARGVCYYVAPYLDW